MRDVDSGSEEENSGAGRFPRTRDGDLRRSEFEVADDVIARIVHRGVVAHDDLIAAGVSRREIAVRVRHKRLIPKWRGVYLVGHAAPAPFALEYAALKFAGLESHLSDRPAAVLYGLLPTQADPTIHLSLDAKRKSPRGLKLHTRHLLPQETRTIQGDIRITTVERTILDIAPTLDDEQLENVVADAIRRKLTTENKLARQLELRKGARGAMRIRSVLDVGPKWTASTAERVFLDLIRAAGLPAPEVNKRQGRRMPDFLFGDQRVIVEIDGYESHKDVIAFDGDRERDTERTVNRWRPARYSWRHLRDRPYWVIATLAVMLGDREQERAAATERVRVRVGFLGLAGANPAGPRLSTVRVLNLGVRRSGAASPRLPTRTSPPATRGGRCDRRRVFRGASLLPCIAWGMRDVESGFEEEGSGTGRFPRTRRRESRSSEVEHREGAQPRSPAIGRCESEVAEDVIAAGDSRRQVRQECEFPWREPSPVPRLGGAGR